MHVVRLNELISAYKKVFIDPKGADLVQQKLVRSKTIHQHCLKMSPSHLCVQRCSRHKSFVSQHVCILSYFHHWGCCGRFDGVLDPVMSPPRTRRIISTPTTSPNMSRPDVSVVLKHKQSCGLIVGVCLCVCLQWVQPWSSCCRCVAWRPSSSCVCVCVSASASSVPTVSPDHAQSS